MKKLIPLLLVLALLAGCGNAAASSAASAASSAASQAASEASEAAAAEPVQSAVEAAVSEAPAATEEAAVSAEEAEAPAELGEDGGAIDENLYLNGFYGYIDSLNEDYEFASVTNTSDMTLDIVCTCTAYDADDNEIAESEMTLYAIAPGEENLAQGYFDDATDIVTTVFQFSYSESQYTSVLEDLTVDANQNDYNTTILVTNNGETDAQAVEAVTLFFDADDNLVGYQAADVTNIYGVIAPGESIAAEMDCDEDVAFDHTRIYTTAYSDGTVLDPSYTDFSDDQVSVTLYEQQGVDTYFYVELTNNSEVPVSVYGNALLADDDDNLLGAADTSLCVLGAGETEIAQFYFPNTSGYTGYDYQFWFSENIDYQPVAGDMYMESSFADDTTVELTITNTGAYNADWVHVYILGFDADGNLFQVTEWTITDEEGEQLAAGETVSTEIECDPDVQTAEIGMEAFAYPE